ncbi:hypothetical protein Hdeb2414_s0020g00562021 [Helianthus debilis subsp. tardiflorus]
MTSGDEHHLHLDLNKPPPDADQHCSEPATSRVLRSACTKRYNESHGAGRRLRSASRRTSRQDLQQANNTNRPLTENTSTPTSPLHLNLNIPPPDHHDDLLGHSAGTSVERRSLSRPFPAINHDALNGQHNVRTGTSHVRFDLNMPPTDPSNAPDHSEGAPHNPQRRPLPFDNYLCGSSNQPANNNEDPYNFVYAGIPRAVHLLKEQRPCGYCGARRFPREFPTFCCMSGKTTLASTPVPSELHQLFTSQEEIGRIFRENIRAYNTNFSFTSMGVSLDETMANMRDGVYTFRAHKGIYHKIDQLVPRDGKPRYLQLYFYDPDNEIDDRLLWPNLDRTITEILTRVLSANPYVMTFRSLAELGPLDNYRVTLNASVELDQRVYNRPTTSEVAGIWVEGNNDITSYKRSIIVYGRSAQSQTIQPYFSCYDPLSYPLFFPNGEAGWHSGIPRNGVEANTLHNDHETDDDDTEGGNNLSHPASCGSVLRVT